MTTPSDLADLVPRHLAERVETTLRTTRVINIVGPRQTGKTTLVRDMIEAAHFLDLDDEGLLASLSFDPFGQLSTLAVDTRETGLPIVIDEVQRLPQITLALKRIVDRDRRPGQFVLTGSSDVFTTPKALDSLAGRVATLTLRPFSAAEIQRAGPCRLLDAVEEKTAVAANHLPASVPFQRSEAIDLILRGGFPEIRLLEDRNRIARYHAYIDSIVERDIAPVADIRRPDALRRLIGQLAQRTAEELNVTSLCNALGARRETVGSYLDVLCRLGSSIACEPGHRREPTRKCALPSCTSWTPVALARCGAKTWQASGCGPIPLRLGMCWRASSSANLRSRCRSSTDIGTFIIGDTGRMRSTSWRRRRAASSPCSRSRHPRP
jgi:predicted AAA+ superfamily ATPase